MAISPLNGARFYAIDAFDCCFPSHPDGFDPPGPMLRTLKHLSIEHDDEHSWRIYRTLEKLLYRGEIASNELFWQFVLEHLEIEPTPSLVAALIKAERQHYQFVGLKLHQGVKDFLLWASVAGYQTILWSNATWTGWETETMLRLPELFGPRLAISCLTGWVKEPLPSEKSLLLWTIQQFKIPSPDKSLVVVDDQLKHLHGSHEEFGCRTVLVLNGKPEPTLNAGAFRPTLIVNRLADLKAYMSM